MSNKAGQHISEERKSIVEGISPNAGLSKSGHLFEHLCFLQDKKYGYRSTNDLDNLQSKVLGIQRPCPSGYRTWSLRGLLLITMTHEEKQAHYHELRFCLAVAVLHGGQMGTATPARVMLGLLSVPILRVLLSPTLLVTNLGKVVLSGRMGPSVIIMRTLKTGEASIFVYSWR